MNSIKKDQAWRRMVAALRLPHFMLEIEAAEHPGLLLRPSAIVGGGREPRILACTPPAQALGVSAGQSWGEAEAHCPRLGRLKARPEHYQAVSRQLMQSLEHISPQLERVALDQAYLDLSSCQSYYRYQPQRIALLIQQRVAELGLGLSLELGLAADQSTAYRAACLSQGQALIIAPQEAEAWLAPQALAEVFDLGGEARQWLAERGVQQCGELWRLPPSLLAQRFGRRGHELWLSAQGQEAQAAESRSTAPLLQHYHHRLLSPCRESTVLLFQLHRLCGKASLEQAPAGAAWRLSLRNKRGWLRQDLPPPEAGLPAATALFQAARKAWRQLWLGEALLHLRLEAYAQHPSHCQADIFPLPLPAPTSARALNV